MIELPPGVPAPSPAPRVPLSSQAGLQSWASAIIPPSLEGQERGAA